MGWLKKYQNGGKKLQSGIVVDKEKNMAKIYQNFVPVDSFPVITGQNSISDKPNIGGIINEERNPMWEHHITPAGTYFIKPHRNIYNYKGFFLENPNLAKDIAIHQTYPGEFAKRNPTYASRNPRDRDMSWGRINCRKPDIDKLYKYFPQGDTLNVIGRQQVPVEPYVYGNPGPSGLYIGEEQNYRYGGYSTTGYKADSPDRNNPYNIIPSGRITMQNVPHPVLGIDNFGNKQMMQPGGEYQFQGDRVFEVPVMQGGGVPPFVTSDINEYNYRKGMQADSNYLHKNLKSYFNKNAKDFYIRNTVPHDPYAIKGNPFGAKIYPEQVANKMENRYYDNIDENKDQLLRNIVKNLQSEELRSKLDPSNYRRNLEYRNKPDYKEETDKARVVAHYNPVKKQSGSYANANFLPYYEIAEDFPAATQEVIFDPKAKKTESKRQVSAKPPVKQRELVAPVPVSNMQQYPMMQPGQPYMSPASTPTLPYDVRVHQWDPSLMSRPDQVKSFLTQEQLEDWKRANRAHSLQGNRYEIGMNQVPSQDGAFTSIEQMKQGGIPQRYKNMGFSRVGQKKTGDGQHKWKVLAKKGDSYKVVQGGYRGMQDFKQHGSQERRDRFWDRMGGRDSSKAKDPFSPLYWHKRFGTWEYGGPVPSSEMYKDGGMIRRADGSYSQRGLWDNIRANAGSGKKPTKEMLQQERKIRFAEKKEYGGWLNQYQEGGSTRTVSENTYVQEPLNDENNTKKHIKQLHKNEDQSVIRESSYVSPAYREQLEREYNWKQTKQNVVKPLLHGADLVTDAMQYFNFLPHPGAQFIGKVGNVLGTGVDALQAGMDLGDGNYGSAAINAGSMLVPIGLESQAFRRNSKYLRPGQPLYPFSPQAMGSKKRVQYLEPFVYTRHMTPGNLIANRALLGTLAAETAIDTKEYGGWLKKYK